MRAAVILAAVILAVYLPAAAHPLRLWDHHAVLLLAGCPQFRHDTFWHLATIRNSFTDAPVYLRVLSTPFVYAVVLLAGERAWAYYAIHFAVHLGVALTLFRIGLLLTGNRRAAVGIAGVFAVFSAHSDTVGIPYYTHLFLALLLAGQGAHHVVRRLQGDGKASLPKALALLAAGTLFYDAFTLLLIATPWIVYVLEKRKGNGPSPWIPAGLSAAVLAFLGGLTLWLGGHEPSTAARGLIPVLWDYAGTVLHRALSGASYALLSMGTDALVFLGGRLPELWHRGNTVYWDLASVLGLLGRAAAAFVLCLGGLRGGAFRGKRPAFLLPCALILLGGLCLDWRVLPMALLAALIWERPPEAPARACAVYLALAAFLCALVTAIGRPDGYNVQALRHHYIPAFFGFGALSALTSGLWRGGRTVRLLGAGCLAAAFLLNAGSTMRMIREVREGNAPVIAFDRLLESEGRLHGKGSLFVPFSTSAVTGLDWWGYPAQDIVFDLLHRGLNPLTRHVHRAAFRIAGDGSVVPNPLKGIRDRGDFLFRFHLRHPPPMGRHVLFGTSADEPRVALEDRALILTTPAVRDGRPLRWSFPAPPSYPALLSLARDGDRLTLMNGEVTLGTARLQPGEEFRGWTSDNLDLLGKDFERLVSAGYLYQTYLRIGASGHSEY